MKVITSKENRIYKHCKALSAKKYRDASGEYLVEGDKLVSEACEAGMAETVIVRSGSSKNMAFGDVTAVSMAEMLFDKITHTQTSQGIVALVRKKVFDEKAFMSAVAAREGGLGNIVVLDRLQDPGNIGTIIRTADAAGYGGIIAIKGTGDIYSPKVVRAAAGSVMRMPVYFASSVMEAVNMLRDNSKKIVGTAFDTDLYYYDADLSENTALVIGNEGNGMSEELGRNTDFNVKIPMCGTIDSLNAAVAAGILMYQSKCKSL